ncbi:Transcriptional regulator, AbiEi antitoxin, Type IV TA system [Micromonospora rhizosphaerae]|uniref:Transcriptional regulator, AbiEi antitoxin, Type IV TA system n=1 Tax=Micromonospora rhizosphaerae TaxID=568872 RepID=A0A1C6SWJ4_9ACTN|nr:Transcriptional regulator, AbiEi antitoxin, Type IV TA system [Micromonospora rhizosphaerae]
MVTRAVAAQVVPESTLRGACHAGRLLRVLPEVYVDAQLVPPAPADGAPVLARLGPELGRRAVLAYADGRGALSSLRALDVWGLRSQRIGEPVHLDVPAGSGIRTRPHLVVHHRLGFTVAPPHVVYRCGIPVVRLDRALVDAWPQLPPADRPAPLIRAANDRLTTPRRAFGALAAAPRLTGRAELRALLVKLAAGCRSPLEIWGHDHVFTGPDMPAFQRQVRIQARGRTVYLDVDAERERVDFELDGASTHGDRRQREVDLRRDALLATLGILVVRFAHRRLVHETDEVRREILAILASRRGGG